MKRSSWVVRSLVAGACLATLMLTSGCTYLKYRGQDAMDMIDIGVTFSSKPQFALYASGPFVQIGTFGFGKVDGHFFGIGEGKASLWGPHYESSFGLLVWGEELVSYHMTEAQLAALPPRDTDLTANFMRVGPFGFIQGPLPSLKYFGSCPHYIHLGWIGFVGGPRYLQMADFLLGWFMIDLCQDDGPKRDVPGGFQLWRGFNPGGRPLVILTPKAEDAPAPAAAPAPSGK